MPGADKKESKLQSLARQMAKIADPSGRIVQQDISRALSIARGMISPSYVAGEAKARMKKAGGGKAMKKKKMMAKGGTAGGKKKMAKGGAAGGMNKRAMMMGGGKTKKMMARGGRAR